MKETVDLDRRDVKCKIKNIFKVKGDNFKINVKLFQKILLISYFELMFISSCHFMPGLFLNFSL